MALRIIGGIHSGRRLISPKGKQIRPTYDRVKETIFNCLRGEDILGKRVLDLYAGTGNLGIEALSRGAKEVVFVDKSPYACQLIRENIELCNFKDCSKVYRKDGLAAIKYLNKKGQAFDLIFLDPPYDAMNLLEKTLFSLSSFPLLYPRGKIVVQHGSALSEEYGELMIKDRRRIGTTTVFFFERKGD